MRQQKKGYLLIEAALGIILLGALYLLSGYESIEREIERKAQLIGKDAADIIHAIDKRIVLDSRVKASYDSAGNPTFENWNFAWVGLADVKKMMMQELVGYKNSECGDHRSGWVPRFSENDDMNLLSCSIVKGEFTTLGFEVDAQRSGITTNPEILSDWSITLFHSSSSLFDQYAPYYSEVIKGFKANDVLKMAGQHRVFYVDRTSGNEISQLAECIKYTTSCGIRFEFKNSQTIYDNEDGELRLDRAMMMDDLTFRVNATTPEKCFQPTVTGVVQVNCGMDFEVTNGKLDVYTNKVSGDSFKLILEELGKNSPVSTSCVDPTKSDTPEHCGLSVIGGGAMAAKGYFDRVYAELLLFDTLDTSEIIIRESMEPNTSGFNEGIRYGWSRMETLNLDVSLKLDDGITFDSTSVNKEMIVKASEDIALTSTTSINMDSSQGELLLSTKSTSTTAPAASQKTTRDQTVNAKAKYFSSASASSSVLHSSLATKSAVLSNVKYIGIDQVLTGSSIPKKKCPSSENGTPSTKVQIIPAEGYWTDRISANYDWGRCSTTGKNNGTGVAGIIMTATSGSNVRFSMTCDVNRNIRVDYGKVEKTVGGVVRIEPYITFDVVGKSGRYGINHDKVNGIKMNVIQYCDYTK